MVWTLGTKFTGLVRAAFFCLSTGKFYTLTTGANERRWGKIKDRLKTSISVKENPWRQRKLSLHRLRKMRRGLQEFQGVNNKLFHDYKLPRPNT
eukprot:1160345-Pelagomonas_calceolata.AAC.8